MTIIAIGAAYLLGCAGVFLACCRLAANKPDRHRDDYNFIVFVSVIWPIAMWPFLMMAAGEALADVAQRVTRRMAQHRSRPEKSVAYREGAEP